ncbi:MAG: choice-of-anchor Q domain-containing protein [Planctomycetota bacterium]|nr:choice-of-anchor Q domain-containing protein [Planctomycetota bacterium]
MRTSSILPFICLCVLAVALAGCGGGGGGGGAGGQAPTWTVTNLSNSGPGTLREATQSAPDGSMIVFDPNLASGEITLVSPITIDRHLIINGLSGALDRFEVSGNNTVRIFEVDPGATLDLRDLVLTEGRAAAGDGGAILALDASIALTRVSIVGSTAPTGGGGAISMQGGMLDMTDSAINACTAGWGGAISAFDVDGRFLRSSLYLNTATIGPGGAFQLVSGQVQLICTTLEGNTASNAGAGGGAIAMFANDALGPTRIWLWFATVTNNSASTGGGVYAAASPAEWCNVVAFHSIIATNTAATGPDLEFDAGADGQGPHNVIGIGENQNWFNGVDFNQVGDAFTPLDPMLDPPAIHSYGRVMRMPQAGSPALDQVDGFDATMPNDDPLPFDQRGAARVVNNFADAGAIER